MDGIAEREAWAALRARRRDARAVLPSHPLCALLAPILGPAMGAEGVFVVGRLAQTLDGRIATVGGSSQWIGGRGDILHTHRLRALCDAVLVGAGTVAHDDPRLTTREVEGQHPLRVVLDGRGGLATDRRIFTEGPATLVLRPEGAGGGTTHGTAEVVDVATASGSPDLRAVLRALAARGVRRLLVEGGGVTVSRFLAAGLLDRLHLTVAPVILGSGRPGFVLPEARRIAEGLRLDWTVHPLEGGDMLFDVALGRARPAVSGGA